MYNIGKIVQHRELERPLGLTRGLFYLDNSSFNYLRNFILVENNEKNSFDSLILAYFIAEVMQKERRKREWKNIHLEKGWGSLLQSPSSSFFMLTDDIDSKVFIFQSVFQEDLQLRGYKYKRAKKVKWEKYPLFLHIFQNFKTISMGWRIYSFQNYNQQWVK